MRRAKPISRANSLDRPFRGRQAVAARCRSRARPVSDRIQDPWPAECRAFERRSDLSCAHGRPARRERASCHQEGGLVGDHGRPRPADRHRALFRHLPERGRRLHGHDRSFVDRSENRKAVGAGFSRHHNSRHGARAGDAARSPRHRVAVYGRRRIDGRHAGPAVGRELSGARVLRAADCVRDAAFGAEHRVSRSRAAGDHGRPRMARRPLSSGKHQSAQGPRGGAHGRAYYLSVRRGAAPEVRPQVPGSRESDVFF